MLYSNLYDSVFLVHQTYGKNRTGLAHLLGRAAFLQVKSPAVTTAGLFFSYYHLSTGTEKPLMGKSFTAILR